MDLIHVGVVLCQPQGDSRHLRRGISQPVSVFRCVRIRGSRGRLGFVHLHEHHSRKLVIILPNVPKILRENITHIWVVEDLGSLQASWASGSEE